MLIFDKLRETNPYLDVHVGALRELSEKPNNNAEVSESALCGNTYIQRTNYPS